MIAVVIEQSGLPGLAPPGDDDSPRPAGGDDPAQPPAGDPGAGAVARNQPAIWDAEPEPRQLALLPDPDPWEADRPLPAGTPGGPGTAEARGGRLARRRRRNAAPPPGQLSLF